MHAVAVLLRRHFEGTMSINKLAVDVLIQPGRAVEYVIGSDLKSDLLAWAEGTVNVAIRRTTESGSAQTRAQPVDERKHQGWDPGAHGRDVEAGAPSLPCGPHIIPERASERQRQGHSGDRRCEPHRARAQRTRE